MAIQDDVTNAIFLARGASAIIMRHYAPNIQVEQKADHSVVTIADKQANTFLVQGLRKRYPLDSIISEEDEGQHIIGSSNDAWYADPLDGTSGFTQHNDEFAVHIAKTRNGIPVLGIVHKPVSGKTYVGIPGVGAYLLSGIKQYPLPHLSPKQNTLACHAQLPLSIKGQELLERLHIQDLEITGSEGLRIMRFATGQASLYLGNITGKAKTWDLCAPHAIAIAAGGLVEYVNGTPIIYNNTPHLTGMYCMARNQVDIARIQGEVKKINEIYPQDTWAK